MERTKFLLVLHLLAFCGLLQSFEVAAQTPVQKPALNITSPADGHTYHQGVSTTATATATDGRGNDISGTVIWSSDIDGDLGTGASIDITMLSVNTHTLTASVTGGGRSQSITITVMPPNVAPAISGIPDQTNKAGDVISVNISTYAADGDGTVVSYSLIAGTLPGDLSLDPSTGIISGTISASAFSMSPYSVTIEVTDDDGAVSDPDASFNWVVVNEAPVITLTGANPQKIRSGTAYTELGATATDTEDGDISSSIVIDASGIDINTPGTYTVTYNVTDSGGRSATTVSRSVVVYALPTISGIPDQSNAEEDVVNLDLSAHAADLDGTVTNYAVSAGTLPQGLSLDPATGLISGTIATGAAANSPFSISIEVTDNEGRKSDPDDIFIWTVTSNKAPTVTINSPADLDTFSDCEQISFSAAAGDKEDDNVVLTESIIWSSSIDGQIGTGGNAEATLSPGTHVITASVTDSGGLEGSATINLTLNANSDPTVTITAPTPTVITRGALVTFSATANDAEDGDLSASLVWTADNDPGFNETGTGFQAQLFKPGPQTITALANDNCGSSGSATVDVTVTEPVVNITSPSANVNGFQISLDLSSSTEMFCDLGDHWRIYINPVDPDNPDPSTAISTDYVTCNTNGTFSESSFTFDDMDGIVAGVNTIVVVAADANGTEFPNSKATVNFNVNVNTQVCLNYDDSDAIYEVNQNDEFDVTVIVQANDQRVDKAEIHLDFDPSIVQVISLTNGSTLTEIDSANGFDNTAGRIDYTASLPAPSTVTGTFSLVTIRFKAIGGPWTLFNFLNNSDYSTEISYKGVSVLDSDNCNIRGAVTVEPSLIIEPDTFTVTLERGETFSENFVVDSNNGFDWPTDATATLTLADDDTGATPTWVSTVANAERGVSYSLSFDSSGLSPGTYTATLTANGVSGFQDYTATISLTVLPVSNPVTVRVFLEGPYMAGSGEMHTLLNDNHLLPGQDHTLAADPGVAVLGSDTPAGHPYGIAPWSHTAIDGSQFGDPSLDPTKTVYDANVVDWILISIRENGQTAADQMWQAPAWLMADGSVLFPELLSQPILDANNDYYLMIEHRNHLPILSSQPVPIVNGKLEYDFTSMDTYKLLFGSGQKEMAPGVYAMITGNGNQLGQNRTFMNSFDYLSWISEQGTIGYGQGDYNLNGRVESIDYILWESNQNVSSDVPY